MPAKIGLILTGGGARAAYQVGALRAIAELRAKKESPFSIIAGVSAGAINSTFLASHTDDFLEGTRRLWEIWAGLKPEKIFNVGIRSLSAIALRWMTELSLGGLVRKHSAHHLLDTAPLMKLLAASIDFQNIEKVIKSGRLHGLAISATNYSSGTAVTFYDGDPGIAPWARSTRIGIRSRLSLQHVMGSTAIPVFFPAVSIGGIHYGDGCIRFSSPVSPAIHMGADRVLAIGVRHYRTNERTMELNTSQESQAPSLAEIVGVLLNAVFLDSLEADVERMQRINRTIDMVPAEKFRNDPDKLRPIGIEVVRPSRDLGVLAGEFFHTFPVTIRHLLGGLGASGDRGADLLSYLAFDKAFTIPLLELGYKDTMSMKTQLQALFDSPN